MLSSLFFYLIADAIHFTNIYLCLPAIGVVALLFITLKTEKFNFVAVQFVFLCMGRSVLCVIDGAVNHNESLLRTVD